MFDFNSDLAQSFGVYKNESEYEIAKYASSVNISAGFHAGDAISIKNAILFAKENNLAIGAHIGYPDIAGFGNRPMDLSDDELEAIVLYQIGAISSFAKTYSTEIENVRCHGAMNEKMKVDFEFAKTVALAVKKINPWLNLYVPSYEVKNVIENEIQINCPYEVVFNSNSSIRQIREMEHMPQTLHFTNLEDIKRAYDVLKPNPVNYNRVAGQV